jgi:hypothetical protein
MMPYEDIGGLPDQLKLPSTPARAQQRYRFALFRAAAEKNRSACSNRHAFRLWSITKQPGANTFEPHGSKKSHVIRIPLSARVLRALIVPTALK